MTRTQQLHQRIAAVLPSPERTVSKQWGVMQRMLRDGTTTDELVYQAKLVDFICTKTLDIMIKEHNMGVRRPEDIATRLQRVLNTQNEAQDLLTKVGANQ